MEKRYCRAHKGGAAFICNITGTCPFSDESSDYDKVTVRRPIHAEKPKSTLAVEKGKPRGTHAKKPSQTAEIDVSE